VLRKELILVILVIGISVVIIPVFAQIEPDIDKKSLFNTKQYDVTAKLTNHNGVPFYFKFDRSFTESKNDAYYELYKVIDSRNNQHVGDFRIYLGSSQWWDDNALLQEDDTSGYSNIIKTKLFVIHLTDPKKIDDVADSLSYALKVLVPEWSSETSPISSDEWFFDSINNAKRNNDDKRENKIIIENKEIRVLHDDVGFGSITLIVTENFDATKKNYVTEQKDLLDELLSSLEKEPEISEKEPEEILVEEPEEILVEEPEEILVEEPKPESSQGTEVICGAGTIRNEKGQCVPARETMVSEMQEKSSSSGGCLIATATFGSELAPQVQQLRELRDNYLLKTESGSAFMSGFNDLYYSFSPTIADLERESPIFKEVVKLLITPLIASLSILYYVDMDSEVEVLGYGISLILLNIGMYIVAPVGIVILVRRKF